MAKCGVLSYLWCNLSRFIVSKPPVAVIFIFIGILAVCFYTLSIYVQTYQIVDEDATAKLSSILDSLLQLTFCLGNSSTKLNSTLVDSRIKSFGHAEFVNLSFPLLTSFSLLERKFFEVHSHIEEVDALLPYFVLHKDDNHLHSIFLQASLSRPLSSEYCVSKDCYIQACVTLQVKKDFAPYGMSFESCAGKRSFENQTIFMHHIKDKKNEQSSCVSKELQLNFNKNDKSYIPRVYLNMWLKSKVNVRLHIASYIFFVLLLSCIIYATMKGRTMNMASSLKNSEM